MGEFTFFPEPTIHVTLLTINFKESNANIEGIKEKIKEQLALINSDKVYQIENIFKEGLLSVKFGDSI